VAKVSKNITNIAQISKNNKSGQNSYINSRDYWDLVRLPSFSFKNDSWLKKIGIEDCNHMKIFAAIFAYPFKHCGHNSYERKGY